MLSALFPNCIANVLYCPHFSLTDTPIWSTGADIGAQEWEVRYQFEFPWTIITKTIPKGYSTHSQHTTIEDAASIVNARRDAITASSQPQQAQIGGGVDAAGPAAEPTPPPPHLRCEKGGITERGTTVAQRATAHPQRADDGSLELRAAEAGSILRGGPGEPGHILSALDLSGRLATQKVRARAGELRDPADPQVDQARQQHLRGSD